jgi:hypothetical protein
MKKDFDADELEQLLASIREDAMELYDWVGVPMSPVKAEKKIIDLVEKLMRLFKLL